MKLIDISTPKHQSTFTMVDDEDFDSLNQWKWTACVMRGSGIRVVRKETIGTKKQKTIWIHRQIMKANETFIVDHIDNNPLNNTKENLRLCAQWENCRNRTKQSKPSTSKYKGVSRLRGRFQAAIGINGTPTYIGVFETEEGAAMAYNKRAQEIYGSFAKLNVL